MHWFADAEMLAVAAVLAVGLGLWRSRKIAAPGRMPSLLLVTAGALLLAWPLVAVRRPAIDRPVPAHQPIEVPAFGYRSSDTCRACHATQYQSWHRSYHRTMTQPASAETAIGFHDIPAELDDRLFVRDGQAWVLLDQPGRTEPSGRQRQVPHRVALTTGSHHYQAYWLEGDRDRSLSLLPFVYLLGEKRWIPRNSAFLAPPELPPADLSTGRWNLDCVKCHATLGRVRGRAATREQPASLDTHVAEFGIGCESCHGPAAAHLEANRNPVSRYLNRIDGTLDPTIVQPAHLSHHRSADVCGQCHSVHVFGELDRTRALEEGLPFRPGQDLADSRIVIRGYAQPDIEALTGGDPHFLEDRFWPDSMIRIAGREYNGLLETPCFQRGSMSCLSCHTMHLSEDDPRPLAEWADDQLGAGMDGNGACSGCHAEIADDLPAHTFHDADSRGSLCYDCHMPMTTVGLLKAIRSHQIDSPDVATELATSRPNACNLCHLDQTLAWTAAHLTNWYGISAPALNEEQQSVAAAVRWALRGDAAERTLAAFGMGRPAAQEASGTDWMAPYLGQLLSDPYAVVRQVAYGSLKTLPGYEELEFDFVAAAAHHRSVSIEVLRSFEADATARAGARRVLLGPDGRLLIDEFQRLLALRDNRRVFLRE